MSNRVLFLSIRYNVKNSSDFEIIGASTTEVRAQLHVELDKTKIRSGQWKYFIDERHL